MILESVQYGTDHIGVNAIWHWWYWNKCIMALMILEPVQYVTDDIGASQTYNKLFPQPFKYTSPIPWESYITSPDAISFKYIAITWKLYHPYCTALLTHHFHRQDFNDYIHYISFQISLENSVDFVKYFSIPRLLIAWQTTTQAAYIQCNICSVYIILLYNDVLQFT